MIRVSIKQLRVICQSVKYDYKYPLMFRLLRLVSIYLTWFFIQINAIPNYITLSGIFAGIASAVALYNGYAVLAVALVMLAVVVDFSDGEVSRYFNTTSKEGTFLDKVHHIIVQSSFLSGIVLWVNNQQPNCLTVAIGFICVLGSIYIPFVNIYAIDVALFKHIKRALVDGQYELRAKSDSPEQHLVSNVAYQLTKILFDQTNRLLEFPYVIIIFSTLLVYDHIHLARDPTGDLALNSALIVYAFLSAFFSLFFLIRIVLVKHIEKKFNLEVVKKANFL